MEPIWHNNIKKLSKVKFLFIAICGIFLEYGEGTT